MSQPRLIRRLSSLLLATLLLFTAVAGQSGLFSGRGIADGSVTTKAHQSEKAKKDHSSDAQLSTTQFEAVVTPVIQLGDSGQTAFLLPAPALLILLLLSVPLLRHFTLPHYFFSYFRQVFGCTIAPNAP